MANPPNQYVGPMALRRLQGKPRWRQTFETQPVTPQAGNLQITLVRRPRTITKVGYKLRAPQVVSGAAQPPLVTGPLGTTALQVPRRPTHYKLSPPAVVAPAPQPPVVTTLRVRLAAQTRTGRQSGYGLAPPAIVDLPPNQPVKVTLAQQKLNRRSVTYKLRPPTVLGTPTAPFVAPPVRVKLTGQPKPRPVGHKLSLPAVLGSTVVPDHICHKTLLVDATQSFGSLTLASGAQGTLTAHAGTAGTLVDGSPASGTLVDSAGSKGTLTDAC